MLSTLAASATPVVAQPKRKPARAQFDRGVAAYKKNNYEGAAAALGKSFELEADPDTLFAWAQAERKLDHCEKALELYEKLMTFDLPAANKAAVQQKHDECNDIIGAKAATATPPEPAPAPTPPPPAPSVAPAAEPEPAAIPHASAGRAWYKDPVALTLLGVGIVGVGAGGGYLYRAKSWHDKIDGSPNDARAHTLADRAKSQALIGTIAAGAGGVLIIGGIIWIATRHHSTESQPLTAWASPTGGGLAFSSSF
ncbi:MAG TPA: hypothetical protein VGC42_30750 [Kofleriaceae bacterium]